MLAFKDGEASLFERYRRLKPAADSEIEAVEGRRQGGGLWGGFEVGGGYCALRVETQDSEEKGK